jgi:hypothetical protein
MKMKKRILIILIGLAMIVGVTVGCTNDKQNQADGVMLEKQAAVDVVGTVQIEEELGIKILLPATIENESCSIIDGKMGLISFDYDGSSYNYYVEASDAELDATGMATSLPNSETVLVDNATYKLAYETDGAGVTYWYDKKNKVACTLLISDKTSPDSLKTVTESILSIQ